MRFKIILKPDNFFPAMDHKRKRATKHDKSTATKKHPKCSTTTCKKTYKVMVRMSIPKPERYTSDSDSDTDAKEHLGTDVQCITPDLVQAELALRLLNIELKAHATSGGTIYIKFVDEDYNTDDVFSYYLKYAECTVADLNDRWTKIWENALIIDNPYHDEDEDVINETLKTLFVKMDEQKIPRNLLRLTHEWAWISPNFRWADLIRGFVENPDFVFDDAWKKYIDDS